jgi:formylmethanofuran dehydrogenase subunit C
MILLRRTSQLFGTIDGQCLRPDTLSALSLDQIKAIELTTDSGVVRLGEVFEVSSDRIPLEPFLVIEGDCEDVDGLAAEMQCGQICVFGNVGHNAGRSMSGGTMILVGNTGNHLAAGMADGLIYLVGDCRDGLASPLPGKKSGMRGGDILVAGSVGNRACERMRRGTVFIAGNAGDYCAPQMVAGSLIVMGNVGCDWAGGMRRGSLILGRDTSSKPLASLSEARDFELSFLPLIWKHVEHRQNEAFAVLNLSISFAHSASQRASRETPSPIRIPRTRWVQRQIADLNCNGRGEVLVLKRVSSPV